MIRKRVLFVTGKLQKYRVPILNLIAEDGIDLTVAHSSDKLDDGTFLFKEVILKEKKIGYFTIHDNDFHDFCNTFEVVVAMFYLQKISLMKLFYKRNRRYKIIYWGIGVKASQNSKFDSPTFLNYIRYFIARKSDAMIFYTEYARDKYIKRGIRSEKLFVMNNTVSVRHSIDYKIEKRNILFTGTLNKSKKISDLLEAYKEASLKVDMPKLEIVGNGEDYLFVENWIMDNGFSDSIVLHGAIYDDSKLEKIFKRALICVSPGQAGLSVLTSFGYGVAFVTRYDAITGGERLNIENGFNGVLFHEQKELIDILIKSALNAVEFIKMGENAKSFYENNRLPEQMAQGFKDAINYVIQNNNH